MYRDVNNRAALIAAITLMGVVAMSTGAPAQQQVILSEGIRLLGSVPFEGGSEIAATDRYVYANQLDGTTARGQYPDRGGLRVLEWRGSRVAEVGSLRCPGNDNDLQPLGRSFVVIAHHTSHCNVGQGMFVVDISRPSRPRVASRVHLEGTTAHTVTPHPRAPYVYVSPGGLFNGYGMESIVDVSDPRRSRAVGEFSAGRNGCHDLTTMIRDDRVYAFCSGAVDTSIWDITDPVKPVVESRILNPAIEFMYIADPSPDGSLLAIVDEAFVAHECSAGAGPGGVWLYDISQLTAPIPVGRIPPPRRGADTMGTVLDVTTWCAAHGIAWHPEEPARLAVTWYSAGLSVFDLSLPAVPKEIAAFQATDSLAEAVVWHKGVLFSNDLRRGVDVFELEGSGR